MKKIFFTLLIAIMLLPSTLFAATDHDQLKAFKSVSSLTDLDLQIPTVIEVPFSTISTQQHDFAILEVETDSFQPYSFYDVQKDIPTQITTIDSIETKDITKAVTDNDHKTFQTYPLPVNNKGVAVITVNATDQISSSFLSITLDKHVALPTSIEIKTIQNNQETIVLAKSKLPGTLIRFPKTTADKWVITLTYAQPLRVAELQLHQNDITQLTQGLRFLARPDMSYNIFFNADRITDITTGESANLNNQKDIVKVDNSEIQKNSLYTPADVDDDTINDKNDNCVTVANTDQADINKNNIGDACEDFDRDTVINSKDNCPDHPNTHQKDIDADGIGDVCDKQESRITESNPWLPWVGIGFVAVIVAGLFAISFIKE